MTERKRGRPSTQIHPQNAKYIEPFEKSFDNRRSYSQYKSTLQSFFQYIDKDVVNCNIVDVYDFLKQYNNSKTRIDKKHHLKSFFQFLIENNIEGFRDKIKQETLIELLKL